MTCAENYMAAHRRERRAVGVDGVEVGNGLLPLVGVTVKGQSRNLVTASGDLASSVEADLVNEPNVELASGVQDLKNIRRRAT